MYPEQLLYLLKRHIKKEWLYAFLSAFCTGLLVHLFRLTNHLLTWDSVYNFHDSQNTIYLGRCFLTLSCGIGSYYDLQWINGLLSLIYLSLVCVCLAELFSLRKKLCIFLVSALTVCFPSVASTFAYMYTADGYFLAMLFMTLAVLLTVRKKYGFLPAVFLIALGYGSYQAYISYAVMLILTWTLIQLFTKASAEKSAFKEILPYWGRFLLMGVSGTVVYLLCYRLLALLEKTSASDYNGIATMSLPNLFRLLQAVKNCLIDFAYFFFGPLDKFNFYKLSNGLLFLLLFLLFFYCIKKNRLYLRPVDFCLSVFCLLAMPFVCSMIYFLSPQVRYYMLMYASFSLFYILPVLFYDKADLQPNRTKIFLCWCCTILTALIIFNFALISNISYLYMKASNEMTFALVNRMVDRIEQLEDFQSAQKLCIVGHFKDFDSISLSLPPAMAGIRNNYIISEQAHFSAMMKTYFNLALAPCTDTEKQTLQNNPEFQEMPCWPAVDSVKQFDDTVIVKIASD